MPYPRILKDAQQRHQTSPPHLPRCHRLRRLDAQVEKHDAVINLISYTFHATVIKSAIRKKKNVVTTSYVSPAMMELEEEVKEAGITVMNEIGLDPGIDHL
jgi:saccharopine dehydrogenase (NADP+, L-glutamate forming)